MFLPGLVVAWQGLRSPDELLGAMRTAVSSKDRARIESLFEKPEVDARYLFTMASDRGGLNKVDVCLLPSPPGWEGYGRYWAVFHATQTIEEDHDPVYRVEDTPTGLKLGSEIPESDTGGYRISSQSYTAIIRPERSFIEVLDRLNLKSDGAQRAPVFRLNDRYRFAPEHVVEETDDRFVMPPAGSLVRAGSLLIPWTERPSSGLDLRYSAVLPPSDEDEVIPTQAFVTAWWLPSVGRLPFTVQGAIEAPADWTVRGEGTPGPVQQNGLRKTSTFHCDLPISYPKVIGGLFQKVASTPTPDGDQFAIYQLPPTDTVLARADLKRMTEAAAFYEKVLAPLPFHGYECYSADRYYGIESYSHTILRRDVTHFISHEMGHTYFGGTAPCPYVQDSWNEGVTEYIDSVVLLHDADHSLENGLRTLEIPVPLSKMAVPWAFNGATYWRGCYVMKMLESEIGPDRVLAALRAIATGRRGQDTRWKDLRPYFEKAGGKPLDWFWNQWIDGAEFPTLTIEAVRVETTPEGTQTVVKVTQSGTSQPFNLRFALQWGTWQQVVSLKMASQEFVLDRPSKASDIHIQVFPYTLAKISQAEKQKTVRPCQELLKK